jgi:uncharacterized membrane protein HdeD (DUF308 family)
MSLAGVPQRTRGAALGFGALLVVAGLVLLAWPAATTLVLVSLLGLGAAAYGVAELGRVFDGHSERLEIVTGLIGLVSIFGGVMIFLTPLVSSVAVGVVVGAYWLVGGAVEVVGAFLRPGGRLVRLLVGVISVIAGLVVLASPAISLVALVWFSGAWLVASGIAVALGALLGGRVRPAGSAPA